MHPKVYSRCMEACFVAMRPPPISFATEPKLVQEKQHKAGAKPPLSSTTSHYQLTLNIAMDPLTITASILQVSSVVLKTGKTLDDLCSRYKTAPLALRSLQIEIDLTIQCLKQLQKVKIRAEQPLGGDRTQLAEAVKSFDEAFTNCSQIIAYIDHELRKIDEKTVARNRLSLNDGWASKLRYLRRHSTLEGLAQQLSRQRGAINLHLQTAQRSDPLSVLVAYLTNDSETIAELQQGQQWLTELMQHNNADMQSLRKRFPKVPSVSSVSQALETQSIRQSILHAESNESPSMDIEPSFEERCINSTAYRQAFARFKRVIAEAEQPGNGTNGDQRSLRSKASVNSNYLRLVDSRNSGNSSDQSVLSPSTPSPAELDVDRKSTLQTIFKITIFAESGPRVRGCILDTSTAVDLISESVASSLNLPIQPYSGPLLKALGGGMLKPLGATFCEWCFFGKSKTYATTFLVLSDRDCEVFDVLLGEQTIRRLGILTTSLDI